MSVGCLVRHRPLPNVIPTTPAQTLLLVSGLGERTATAEREAHARREARSAAAFARLVMSSRDHVWADSWKAFIVRYLNDEVMKAQVLNNIRLYDAVLAAETVPAKRKAIKAFLVAFEKADDVR